MSSLFRVSSAKFLRAVAAAHTTLSASIVNSSTMIGRPRSLRTAARNSCDGWETIRISSDYDYHIKLIDPLVEVTKLQETTT